MARWFRRITGLSFREQLVTNGDSLGASFTSPSRSVGRMSVPRPFQRSSLLTSKPFAAVLSSSPWSVTDLLNSPPAEERMGGREGRERPGLLRIWVGAGPARRVAHAPCLCLDRPEKRGPDRVGSVPCFVPRSRTGSRRPSCSRSSSHNVVQVGSRTDRRSPVHTEAARPAETGRRPAASRVHHKAWRLVRQRPPNRPTSAPALHQRTVSASGRTSDHRIEALEHRVSGRRMREAVPHRHRRSGHRR